MTTIDYYGWLGHQNLGDESLYIANDLLFSNSLNISEEKESETILIGGGTVFPHLPIIDQSKLSKYENRHCIGVGVRDPLFWNRKMTKFDLPYLFGRLDLNFSSGRDILKESLPRPIRRTLSNSINRSNSLEVNRRYHHSDSYREIHDLDFDKISVRGPNSKKILDSYGINSVIIGDPALYLEPTEYTNEENNTVGVCLQHDTYKWAENREYLGEIVTFLRSLSDDYSFVFLPMYPSDIEINKKIADLIDNSTVKDYTTPVNVQGYLNEVSECDLMISEKLHGNILSACSYTPFISLEYRPKSFDFAASVGFSNHNIRIDRLNADTLHQSFEFLIHNEKVVNKLQTRVDEKREDLEQYAAEIESGI